MSNWDKGKVLTLNQKKKSLLARTILSSIFYIGSNLVFFFGNIKKMLGGGDQHGLLVWVRVLKTLYLMLVVPH